MPELQMPEFPNGMGEFWQTFLDLHNARDPDRPIAFSEILAYSALTGRDFNPLEITGITRLDRAYRQERAAIWQT